MRNYLPELVKRTPTFLINIRFNLFIDYCFRQSFNKSDAQDLITNQTLFNWFNKQVDMLEEEFLHAVATKKILTTSSSNLYVMYYSRISKVLKLSPMRILNKIREDNKLTRHTQLNFNYN